MKNGTLYSVVKHIPVTPLKPAYAIQMSSEKDGKGFCELNKHDISPSKRTPTFIIGRELLSHIA